MKIGNEQDSPCDSPLFDDDSKIHQESPLQSEKLHDSVFETTSQSSGRSDKCKPKADGFYLPVKRGRVLTKFMSTPCQPSRLPVRNPKSCGKVLTSREQIKILEEKAQKKEEIEREKEEKRTQQEEARRIREEKKKMKEEEKRSRDQDKENRLQRKGSKQLPVKNMKSCGKVH